MRKWNSVWRCYGMLQTRLRKINTCRPRHRPGQTVYSTAVAVAELCPQHTHLLAHPLHPHQSSRPLHLALVLHNFIFPTYRAVACPSDLPPVHATGDVLIVTVSTTSVHPMQLLAETPGYRDLLRRERVWRQGLGSLRLLDQQGSRPGLPLPVAG